MSRFRDLSIQVMRPLLLRIFSAINAACKRHAGGERRAVFYDIARTYPELSILEQNFDVIMGELRGVLEDREGLPQYHDLDHHQDEISANSPEKWRVFMLDIVGKIPTHGRKTCPRTVQLIRQIPFVNQAFFSILEPNKSVPAHEGPYCGYLRYHLGMVTPKRNPPHIRVKDQKHVWKEREGVLFDDSWEHEVVNHSSELRVVLLVDVLRPSLPWYLHKLNLLWTRFVGGLYAEKIESKLERFRSDNSPLRSEP